MDKTSGQMTVFFSLLLISFLLVLNVCVEGIYAWMAKGAFHEQMQMSGEYALANYHKELWEQFHLLAVDTRYYHKMESSLKTNWQRNGNPACSSLNIQPDKNLTDVETLKDEIREYMKYKETADLVKTFTRLLKGVEEESESNRLGNQVGKVKKPEEEKVEEESGPVVEDPRKGLSKLLAGDILTLVLPDGHALSKKKISIVYGAKGSDTTAKVDFFNPESVEKKLKENRKKASGIATEALGIAYAGEVFTCATDPARKDGVRYEMEYLIGGRNRDDENLKAAVNKLILVRFCINYGFVLKSPKKQAQAKALTAGVAGPASAVPGVVEGISMLLLAAWAYGESIVDVRGLLDGKKIAFTKTEETFALSLSNLAKLKGSAKSVKNGITYQEYLQVLLLLQTQKDEKYKRMMDVISLRIQEKQKDFSMKESYHAFVLTVEEKVGALFMGTGYTFSEQRVVTY